MDGDALLPVVGGPAHYRSLQAAPEHWLPAMRAICGRHGLPADRLRQVTEGTNVVFAAGDAILKLYPPHWARLAATEVAVARRVYGRLPVETPEVLATGSLASWPYVVMRRLRGRELHEVWETLEEGEQRRIGAQLGEVMARLHDLPTADLPELEADWPAAVDARVSGCADRHREQGAATAWVEQIRPFLASAAPLYPPDFRPVIVSGDVHDYHLLVEEWGGSWRLTGLFDFDDARLGFEEYDLAAPGLFMMAGRAPLLRTFLHAYGYPSPMLDRGLSRRLLAYTLLHRYRELNWILDELVPGAPATLDQLAETIYPLA